MSFEKNSPIPANAQDLCMDWNDVIEDDGPAFITLEEGDYNFTVTGCERGHFPGSQKIPPCNKVSVSANVHTDHGDAFVKFDFFLYRTLEWRISAFYRCIGRKKHGEKLIMDWNATIGAQGRAHIRPRKYTDRYGEERTVNDVVDFHDYNPAFFGGELPKGFVEVTDEILPF